MMNSNDDKNVPQNNQDYANYIRKHSEKRSIKENFQLALVWLIH